MEKVTNNTAENVRNSVNSLYKQLMEKRSRDRAEKDAAKEAERAAKKAEQEAENTKPDGTKMTKKEKRQAELDNWKEIVIGLTGDDLEYSSKKAKKKKYRKWIDDDENSVTPLKPKKQKKRNYNKEFEPELNMLRTLISDQNKFTADLQRRFVNAAGPATKEATPPSKTMVELAAAIMTGRGNSLSMLREIGSIKKTIYDLYMKQKKLDSDLAGATGADSADLGLLGSNIATSLFGNPIPSTPMDTPITIQQPTMANQPVNFNTPPAQPNPAVEFDPSTWDGPDIGDSYTKYESIPHQVVVKQSADGNRRFVAIRDDNGEELVGCHVPTIDPNSLSANEKDMTVRGQFDEIYKLIKE